MAGPASPSSSQPHRRDTPSKRLLLGHAFDVKSRCSRGGRRPDSTSMIPRLRNAWRASGSRDCPWPRTCGSPCTFAQTAIQQRDSCPRRRGSRGRACRTCRHGLYGRRAPRRPHPRAGPPRTTAVWRDRGSVSALAWRPGRRRVHRKPRVRCGDDAVLHDFRSPAPAASDGRRWSLSTSFRHGMKSQFAEHPIAKRPRRGSPIQMSAGAGPAETAYREARRRGGHRTPSAADREAHGCRGPGRHRHVLVGGLELRIPYRDGVRARRHVLDREGAAAVNDRVVGVLTDEDVAEHLWVDTAKLAVRYVRLLERVAASLAGRKRAEIESFVVRREDVVSHGVVVPEVNRVTGGDRRDPGHELHTLLVDDGLGWRVVAGDIPQVNDRVPEVFGDGRGDLAGDGSAAVGERGRRKARRQREGNRERSEDLAQDARGCADAWNHGCFLWESNECSARNVPGASTHPGLTVLDGPGAVWIHPIGALRVSHDLARKLSRRIIAQRSGTRPSLMRLLDRISRFDSGTDVGFAYPRILCAVHRGTRNVVSPVDVDRFARHPLQVARSALSAHYRIDPKEGVTMRPTRKGTLLFAALAGVAVYFVALSEARAVPSFSRKYKTSCQTCHTVYPVLNAFGEAFRRDGYRFPSTNGSIDSDAEKAPAVELGQEQYKTIFPKAVYPDKIAEAVPLSAWLNGGVSLNLPNSAASSSAAGTPFAW